MQQNNGGNMEGGGIPEGNPGGGNPGGQPPLTLIYELIHSLQQNQGELAESIRQLKESSNNREAHGGNGRNHEERDHHDERDSNNKNDAPFVTMSDGSAVEHIQQVSWTPWAHSLEMGDSVCGSSQSLSLTEHTPAQKQLPGEDLLKYIHRFHDISSGLPREINKPPTEEEKRDPKFCRYHRYVHHPTADCRSLRWELNRKIQDGTLQLSPEQQRVHKNPFPNHRKDQGKAVVSVVIRGSTSDMEVDESAVADTTLTPAVSSTQTTADPFMWSAVIKDVQVRRALVDTGSCLNLIPLSTLKAANIPQHKIQGAPIEVTGFGGAAEYTMGHIQPWLHKHKLISSTYHQCIKGRLNGKPIRIAANPSPFDQTEAHFIEAALYDELSTEEPSIIKPSGTPLPDWEDIRNDPDVDLREVLERKKKRKERMAEDENAPRCIRVQMPDGRIVYQTEGYERLAVEKEEAKLEKSAAENSKITPKEDLEVINLSHDPGIDKPVSISTSLSAVERACLIKSAEGNLVPKPVVQPARTFHTEVEAQITQEVKKLLAAGFIKPIQHPRWLSNIVPVKKKNGQIRCCVDFRNLNKACPKDEFPLPNMDLLIDSATGSAMFSFMDGFSGYNQIRMSPRDAEKTAFRTPIGNFYYTVMPFGLKNAGATYQRMMTAMFHDMIHQEIEDYVDDIVVKSKRREDHVEVLRKVFERCRLYKLKMNPLKCAFGVSAGKFLGFLVHNRGIDVDPAKASAIATMKPPTSHKELKSFFREVVLHQKCQEAFERIQAIMTKLPTVCAPTAGKPLRLYLASNSQAIGALVAQEDDDGIEQPVYYVSRGLKDTETRYSVAERASIKSQAIADLLAQFPGEDSSTISQEVPGEVGGALLVGMADSIWTLNFDGSSTSVSSGAGVVLTREDGETIAKSFKLDFPCSNNASEYESLHHRASHSTRNGNKALKVTHALRSENRYADALAALGSQVAFEGPTADVTINKRSIPITDLLREEYEQQDPDKEDWRTPLKSKLILPGGILARCVSPQEGTKKLQEVHEKSCELEGGVSLYRRLQRLGYFWPDMSKEAADLQRRCPTCQHQHENEQWYPIPKGIPWRSFEVSKSVRISNSDERGSFRRMWGASGKKRLYQLLLTLGYYWPTMKRDTADFVKACHTCQMQANLIHTHPTNLQNMATPWPFHTWGLDLIGPINPPSGGYIWILAATEYFTKWVEAIPLRKATGAAVANFIREHIITRFGIPHKFISDNGTPFVNKDVREMLEHYRIKHRRSTPYYPQEVGALTWRMCYGLTADHQRQPQVSPLFSLVYGTDVISPPELLVPSPRMLQGTELEADIEICAEARVADLEGLDEARELALAHSLRYHQRLANAYGKTVHTRIFSQGQMVLKTADHVRRGLPSPSKFTPNWEGPYVIREAHDSGYYRLSKADGTILADPINGKWLKEYYS
uniref:Integrase catalytic domain-containing protein n=1 Tax=Fagus sylvatica TaxID=28930 RepID=A0A2N9HC24_FAGSY